MKKAKKNISKKVLPSIFGTPLTREYLRQNPITPKMIDYVCDALNSYASTPDATYVGVFLRDMRIPKGSFYRWVEEYPQLKEALKEADEHIGYNRMDACIKRRFDKSAVLHSQYRFGKEWKEDDAYASELNKKHDEKHGTKIVILEKYPETKDVPEKK